MNSVGNIELSKFSKMISELISIALVVFLFEPNIFVKVKYVNYIFIVGIVLTFVACLYSYWSRDIKISNIIVVLVIHRFLMMIPTMINDGDIVKWGYQSILSVSILMIVDLYSKKNEFNKILNWFQNIFFVYLCINYLTLLLFPNGIIKAYPFIKFIGIRTRITDYAFPLIFMCCINFKNRKKMGVLGIVISLLNIIHEWVSTAIAGLIIVAGVYILLKIFNTNKKIQINSRVILTIALLICVSVTFFRVQELFAVFIEDVLNKNVTLTGRTNIWDLSYKYIEENIFFGHGYINDGNFVLYNRELWQAHNQFIQTLYEGGIIGLFLLVLIFYKVVNKLENKNISVEKYNISIAFFAGFVIMLISEIYLYYPMAYVLFAIMINLHYLDEDKKEYQNNAE